MNFLSQIPLVTSFWVTLCEVCLNYRRFLGRVSISSKRTFDMKKITLKLIFAEKLKWFERERKGGRGGERERRELMNSLSVKGRERSLRLLPSWQNKMNNYNEATDVLQSDSTQNRYRPLSAESGPDGRLVPAVGTNQIAGFVEHRPLTNWEKITSIISKVRPFEIHLCFYWVIVSKLIVTSIAHFLTLASSIAFWGRRILGKAYKAPVTSLHVTPSKEFNIVVVIFAFLS